MKRKRIAWGAALFILAALLAYSFSGGRVPRGQPDLQPLTSRDLPQIKSQFNAAQGDVRILLLLSPT